MLIRIIILLICAFAGAGLFQYFGWTLGLSSTPYTIGFIVGAVVGLVSFIKR
ncbi:hypothetical protein [Desulfobaculum bizertense]|uniref:Uncharacterized protein n=1 Tax=Desulfobaculum bizertense DSM 18034 TaxID=1121442 RepID=A0A1T4VIG1_9BACT|nr:hypothetical protein [Desulfobaculum bizertense]UIJ37844.1 hypothetical protein LWC08_14290 [Desulfobaculum bizertense]SKA64371.1 hypothetical protein SAMN02745702_00319 [Desulfobaculum bizertense DSM 18034]